MSYVRLMLDWSGLRVCWLLALFPVNLGARRGGHHLVSGAQQTTLSLALILRQSELVLLVDLLRSYVFFVLHLFLCTN